jgi:hypothetical protein
MAYSCFARLPAFGFAPLACAHLDGGDAAVLIGTLVWRMGGVGGGCFARLPALGLAPLACLRRRARAAAARRAAAA